MKDIREEKRMRSIKGARAIVADSGVGFDCIIRNISGSGACVEFDDLITLGPRFQLHIKTENKTVRASTSWQRGRQAGVQFDEKLSWIERHMAA